MHSPTTMRQQRMAEVSWDEEGIQKALAVLIQPNESVSNEVKVEMEAWEHRCQQVLQSAEESERITETDLQYRVNAR